MRCVGCQQKKHARAPTRGRGLVGLVVLTCSILLSCRSSDSETIASKRGRGPSETWAFDTIPIVTIPGNPDDETAFDGVVGAVRTADGVAVGDLRNQQVKFYRSDGSLRGNGLPIATNSRRLLWIGRCPGTEQITAQDIGSKTFIFLDDSGHVIRSIGVPNALTFARLLLCDDDGMLFFAPYPSKPFTTEGILSARASLVRLGTHGERTVLGAFTATEFFFSKKDKTFIEQPLGDLAFGVGLGEEVLIGASGNSWIDVVDTKGRTKRRFNSGLTPRPAVAGDLLEALTLRIYKEPSTSVRQRDRKTIVQTPLLRAELLYDALLADKQGNAWLRTFEIPRRDSVRWSIVDRTGSAVASITLPSNLYLTEIGSDYILGVQRGVGVRERVSMYALKKSHGRTR
jgi:hypothetical protein